MTTDNVIRVDFRKAAPVSTKPREWYFADGMRTLLHPELKAWVEQFRIDNAWWWAADIIAPRKNPKPATPLQWLLGAAVREFGLA